ncbi:glycosyltransferase [Gaetbulibacter sp. M235]|uniref:glycosyltransferase n=1 Tax=Gaetbulibacter sp. M235 TaxID=3126510 RepID=UPI00374F342D
MILLDFVFYIFVFVVCIQVIFYIFIFGKFAFLKSKKGSSSNLPISVIVCAKNEAENLKKFLPSIISQVYPSFEIILINDASIDKTLKVMESFASKHDNIKIVNVKNIEAFWGNKKYALTLGIKVAKHNHLLFTDADCKPVSEHWISEMCSLFDDTKTIVLGYGAYKKIKKSFLNKLIRFETLMTAIHYFSFAKIGLPYMGVGRNLAYKKSEFFSANGFISHMNVRSGDDDLLINQIATAKNTAICFSQESFTKSIPETKFKDWFNQKRRHISTANYYKLKHKILLASLYVSQLFFWILAITLLALTFKWKIVLSLFLFIFIIQYIVIGFSTKKIGEKDTLIFLPFLEIFLIITQLTIFINNLISKPNHWK